MHVHVRNVRARLQPSRVYVMAVPHWQNLISRMLSPQGVADFLAATMFVRRRRRMQRQRGGVSSVAAPAGLGWPATAQ